MHTDLSPFPHSFPKSWARMKGLEEINSYLFGS